VLPVRRLEARAPVSKADTLRAELRRAGWATCERLPAGALVESFESPNGVAFVVPLSLSRAADAERLRLAIVLAEAEGVALCVT
jgi:hypothetical protein